MLLARAYLGMQCFWGESAFAKRFFVRYFDDRSECQWANNTFFMFPNSVNTRYDFDLMERVCQPIQVKGIKKTRVGYAGGTTANPTYGNIGDHTEITEVQFDPTMISYEQVLEFFWSHHNPAQRRKKQYQSAILYETDEEKKIAENSYKWSKYGDIETYVVKLDKFYQAEDYHQKYWLRNQRDIFDELKLNDSQVANSILAAKINAYCAGYTDFSELEELQKDHGLSDSLVDRIKRFASAGGDPRACH